MCGLIVSFRSDNKIITETSYLKLTIKPHKLHYKCNLYAQLFGIARLLFSKSVINHAPMVQKPHPHKETFNNKVQMDLIPYSFVPLISFRVPYTLDLLPYYLSIANGTGGVGIFELLVFQCIVSRRAVVSHGQGK